MILTPLCSSHWSCQTPYSRKDEKWVLNPCTNNLLNFISRTPREVNCLLSSRNSRKANGTRPQRLPDRLHRIVLLQRLDVRLAHLLGKVLQ
jgi:hypothetical protein